MRHIKSSLVKRPTYTSKPALFISFPAFSVTTVVSSLYPASLIVNANSLASLVPASTSIIIFESHVHDDDDDDGDDHGHGHGRDDDGGQYAPSPQYGKGTYHNSFLRHLAMPLRFGR